MITFADKQKKNTAAHPDTRQRKPSQEQAGGFSPYRPEPVLQRKENNTGLPDGLKSSVESLSGMDMSPVRVHRNSPKPAALNAHAYTQGTNIFLGPGQEKHLAHESWHVVQQSQGRVRPTMQMAGQYVNDNAGLEKEADIMGSRAGRLPLNSGNASGSQAFALSSTNTPCIQGFFIKDDAVAKGRRNPRKKLLPGATSSADMASILQDWKAFKADQTGGSLNYVGNTVEFVYGGNKRTFEAEFGEPSSGNPETDVQYFLDMAKRSYVQAGEGSFSGIARASEPPGGPRENYGTLNPYKGNVAPPSSFAGGMRNNYIPQGGGNQPSYFEINAKAGALKTEMTHYSPWNRGARVPSQISVMGGNNALSYYSGLTGIHQPGRFEWLHMVGSALGGLNVLGNLVAGSFDANTAEIPLENHIASWQPATGPNPNDQTKITATVGLFGDTWIANGTLSLTGEHNGMKKEFRVNPMKGDKLLKDDYKKAENAVENNAVGSWTFK